MINVTFDHIPANDIALFNAFRAALGDAISGASYNEAAITVHFHTEPTSEQIDTAQSVIDAHDPIYMTADRTVINADGIDEAIITLRVPEADRPAVTVTIDPGAGAPIDQQIDFVGMTENTIELSSTDPQTITVSINDNTRSLDSVRIEAI